MLSMEAQSKNPMLIPGEHLCVRVARVITELSNRGVGVWDGGEGGESQQVSVPACFLSCDLFNSSFLVASGSGQPCCCQAGGRDKASQGAGLGPEHVYSLEQSLKAWLTFPSRARGKVIPSFLPALVSSTQ